MDANTNTVPNEAFTFIGTGAFTGVAGQLRYDIVGSRTYVYGDQTGDGNADFVLRLETVVNLVAGAGGDFVL